MCATAGIDWRIPGLTLRELEVRDEARLLAQWDAVAAIQESIELLPLRHRTQAAPRSWLELRPVRTKRRVPCDPNSPSGFDQLLSLAGM